MASILPKIFRKEKPYYTTEQGGSLVLVIHDKKESKKAGENRYAVFSKSGFHGWLKFGFTQKDLNLVLDNKPSKIYEDKLNELRNHISK